LTWQRADRPLAVGGATGTGDDNGIPGGSSDDGSGFPTWVIIVVGVVIIGGIVFFLARRGKGETPDAEDAAVAEPKKAPAKKPTEEK